MITFLSVSLALYPSFYLCDVASSVENVRSSLADQLVLLGGFQFVMCLFGDVVNVYFTVV